MPEDGFSEIGEEIEDEKYRYRITLVADLNGIDIVKLVILKKDQREFSSSPIGSTGAMR